MHHQLPEVAVADTHRLPQPTSSAWEWQLHGACRGADASIFFHPEGERGAGRAAPPGTVVRDRPLSCPDAAITHNGCPWRAAVPG